MFANPFVAMPVNNSSGIHELARRGDLEGVKAILVSNPSDISKPQGGAFGDVITPLHAGDIITTLITIIITTIIITTTISFSWGIVGCHASTIGKRCWHQEQESGKWINAITILLLLILSSSTYLLVNSESWS